MERQGRNRQIRRDQQERKKLGEREESPEDWEEEPEYEEESPEDWEEEPEYGEESPEDWEEEPENQKEAWEERKEEGKKENRRKYQIDAALCGVVFVCALLFLASYYARQKHGERVYEEMRREQSLAAADQAEEQASLESGEAEEAKETGEQEPEEETSGADLSLRRENTVDFEALEEQNPDVCAWITVPGTQVDYPVLQHPSVDDYYLNHTIDRREGLPGSIYLEAIHPKDFSAVHTVLYGHNMKNGTMFGSLHSYEDPAFFRENPYMYVYLPDRTLIYQIYAAVRFSDAYLPEHCSYEEEEAFLAFIEELKNSPGQVDPQIQVPFGSRILTLSTCIANDGAHRFLVGAVLIDEYQR